MRHFRIPLSPAEILGTLALAWFVAMASGVFGASIAVLGIGQSNAGGQGNGTFTTAAGDSLVYWNALRGTPGWAILADPLRDSMAGATDIDYNPGAAGDGASVWTPLANRLHELYPTDSVRVIVCALASCGLTAGTEQWHERGSSTIFHQARTRCAAAGLVPDYVVYFGGETDVTQSTWGALYGDTLRALCQAVRDSIGAAHTKSLIVQLGRRAYNASLDSGQSHVRAVAAQVDDSNTIYLGAVTIDLAVNSADTGHISARGLDTLGTRLAETIAYIRGDRASYRGPRYRDSFFTALDRIAVLLHTTPSANSDASGFSVLDLGVGVGVDSAYTRGDTIYLELTDAIQGACRARYAWGTNFGVAAPIYDTASVRRPLEPFDQIVPGSAWLNIVHEYLVRIAGLHDVVGCCGVRQRLAALGGASAILRECALVRSAATSASDSVDSREGDL